MSDAPNPWPIGLTVAWHPVAYVSDVAAQPLAVQLLGRRLVLFRSGDGYGLLDDRCPHRNVPLSGGQCVGDHVECPYHGWQFDAAGHCRKVPGAVEPLAVSAQSWPLIVRHGLIWTNLSANPAPFPTLPAEVDHADLDCFWWHLPVADTRIGDAIENLLDPIHSYFLHPGTVRRSRNPQPMVMDFTVHADGPADGCTARYTEPHEGMTWLQRLTEGDRTHSYGRYWGPTVVQIAFDDSRGLQAAITVIFSPVDAGCTRPYAMFSTRRGRLPAWLKRRLLIAFHRPVIAQDTAMLSAQSRNADAFGGPAYRNGPLDLFGPVIWDSLNGRALSPFSTTITLSS